MDPKSELHFCAFFQKRFWKFSQLNTEGPFETNLNPISQAQSFESEITRTFGTTKVETFDCKTLPSPTGHQAATNFFKNFLGKQNKNFSPRNKRAIFKNFAFYNFLSLAQFLRQCFPTFSGVYLAMKIFCGTPNTNKDRLIVTITAPLAWDYLTVP